VSSPYRRSSYGAGIEILREACVSQAGQPLSTLVEAGRARPAAGPGNYPLHCAIAGDDPNPNPTANTAELGGAPLHTTGRLTGHCRNDSVPELCNEAARGARVRNVTDRDIAAKRATAALKPHSAPSEVANDFGLLDGGRKSLARWPADNKR